MVVTFELNEEMVLLVTAHDRIDDQCKSLVIKVRVRGLGLGLGLEG